MTKLCMLGCGGFIGSHLLERLLASGLYECTGIDEDNAKIGHLLRCPGFRFIQGDIYSLPETSDVIRDCEVVISLAAICNPAYYNTEPLKVIASNYDHPAQVVKTCVRHRRRLIHFSTSEVYGKTAAALGLPVEVEDQMLREDRSHLLLGPVQRQRWTYACAKQLLERVIYAYGAEQGLDYTIVRPFNFIGPRMDYIPGVDGEGIPRVMACFMDSLLFNKPLRVVDGGHNRRVFTDIEDAVDAVVRIIERPQAANRRIFNIGNPDSELSIKALADKMVALYPEIAGEPVPDRCEIVNEDSEVFYGQGYDDSDRRLPDISMARKLLGWQPKYGLDETLRRTMKGFLDHYRGMQRKG